MMGAGGCPSASLPGNFAGRFGRHDMIRKSIFAMVAALMTLTAFSGTVSTMAADSGQAIYA